MSALPPPYQITVAYSDTDTGGVIYHGRYLEMAERARLHTLGWLDYPISKMLQQDGGAFVVRNLTIDYRAPAKLEDRILITTTTADLKSASVTFRQEFFCNEKMIVLLQVNLAFVATLGASAGRPIKIPPTLAGALRGLQKE